jgi:hypothetical protein
MATSRRAPASPAAANPGTPDRSGCGCCTSPAIRHRRRGGRENPSGDGRPPRCAGRSATPVAARGRSRPATARRMADPAIPPHARPRRAAERTAGSPHGRITRSRPPDARRPSSDAGRATAAGVRGGGPAPGVRRRRRPRCAGGWGPIFRRLLHNALDWLTTPVAPRFCDAPSGRRPTGEPSAGRVAHAPSHTCHPPGGASPLQEVGCSTRILIPASS